MPAPFLVDGQPIGEGHPPYIIAELSGNHNRSLDRALQLVEEAKKAGANAVKLQTYTADTITIDHDGPEFQIHGGLWDGRTLYDLYAEAHTPWEWHEPLFARGRELGITVFSSPFDFTAVEFLESLDAPAYKIASPEIVDIPLIERVAATGKPVIMSTGMASRQDIDEAVQAVRRAGGRDLALLHCISAYPTPVDQCHLASLPELAHRYDVTVGLSDHSLGTTAAVVSIALGARLVEKHFTLSRSEGGVDSAFSLEPEELARLVVDCRDAYAAIGRPAVERPSVEQATLRSRRSLYVVADIKQGEIFTAGNIRSIRPANGLAPKYYRHVLGRVAARDLKRGTPLAADMIVGFTLDAASTTE